MAETFEQVVEDRLFPVEGIAQSRDDLWVLEDVDVGLTSKM